MVVGEQQPSAPSRTSPALTANATNATAYNLPLRLEHPPHHRRRRHCRRQMVLHRQLPLSRPPILRLIRNLLVCLRMRQPTFFEVFAVGHHRTRVANRHLEFRKHLSAWIANAIPQPGDVTRFRIKIGYCSVDLRWLDPGGSNSAVGSKT